MKFSALVLLAILAVLPLMGSTLTVTSLADSGTGSLRNIISLANNGDTIDFAVPGTITLLTPLDINTSLTIAGPGITIDGSSSGTIFNLGNSASDTLSYLTLQNGDEAITGTSGTSVSVLDSTISGSAVGLFDITGAVTDSTFSGNTVAIDGGTVNLCDSTISGGGSGTEDTNLTIGNTIIDGNTQDVGAGTVVTDRGNNLIGSGIGFTNGADGDIVGTNADLGPLANNGGPTETYGLQAGSPAIDAGDNAIIPAGINTDQRGAGYPRISDGTVDIGAFEVQVQQAPEPATYLTCLLGLSIGMIRRRKR